MLLSREDAEQFLSLHASLLHFVNQRLNVVPDIANSEDLEVEPINHVCQIRTAFLEHVELIDAFVDENPAKRTDAELEIVRSWRHMVVGKFYLFRQLKNYMVFLSSSDEPVAYGVLGLSKTFDELIGQRLPVLVDAVLLPFKGKIITDGMLHSYSISFGGGIKRMLNDTYRQAKEKQGVVTSLPIELPTESSSQTAIRKSKAAPKKRKPKQAKTSAANNVKPALASVVELTDQFCQQHLNEEYAELCRKLAEKLSRKRPSPLLRGRVETWACGIIRTIGWVNYLDDRSAKPHMKLTAIDKALGVAESTGQGKSKEIRKLLKIYAFDMNWTLPSRIDDNVMGWTVELNGLPIDVRQASREIQEAAFKKGMIPYIPADRDSSSVPNSRSRNTAAAPDSDRIYQFKITLKDSPPDIWRRIQIQDCTLDKLHEHIQTSMGWTNSHLYEFDIEGEKYGCPTDDDTFMEYRCADTSTTSLSSILPADGKRYRFEYVYDFGDYWQHDILFEGCPPVEARRKYPLCLEGARACPPEDIGGIWGYEEFLAAMADKDHEQHAEMQEWIGDAFDPEAFDPVEATQRMRSGLPAWF